MITTPRAPDPLLAGTVAKLLLSDMKWRHHKIGLLQAYVFEADSGVGMEMRIHVWHPDLCLSDEDSGRTHDHRFRLRSTVLLGAMHDTEVDILELGTGLTPPNDEEVYQMWEIQNARKAAASGEYWANIASKDLYTVRRTPHVYSMGATYTYPPRKFHRSSVEKLTVTICTKTEQSEEPARLLAKVGAVPKHAFDPGPAHGVPEENRFDDILMEAAEKLRFAAQYPYAAEALA